MDPVKKTYSCINVDDEPLDRLALKALLQHYSFITLAGSFPSAEKALEYVGVNGYPDACFMDVDMPGKNGLDLRKELRSVPACIFVTAHPEFALESFELAALDYIVKPLSEERLEMAMRRLQEYLDLHFKAAQYDFTVGATTVTVKEGYGHIKVPMQEIIYLEALRDYTSIVTKSRKYCVLSPLGTLIQEKPFQQFIRIHRSYAVNGVAINAITAGGVRVFGVQLPLGKSYRDTVEKYFNAWK